MLAAIFVILLALTTINFLGRIFF